LLGDLSEVPSSYLFAAMSKDRRWETAQRCAVELFKRGHDNWRIRKHLPSYCDYCDKDTPALYRVGNLRACETHKQHAIDKRKVIGRKIDARWTEQAKEELEQEKTELRREKFRQTSARTHRYR
jgi:hypothetical protein